MKLIMQAMANTANHHRLVYVVFCDTGVESPVVTDFIKYAFKQVDAFAEQNNLPISTNIVSPEIKNRFWIKVIGRGCPPPTNKFRWCTDKLRVNPLRDFCLKHELTNITIILGVRKGESHQRDRTVKKYVKRSNYLRYYSSSKYSYYCPILNFSDSDVWNCMASGSVLSNRFYSSFAKIYSINEKSENLIVSSNGHRMGCWVCTVVRKDKSAEELVKRGYSQLKPYLRFRGWLSSFRDNPRYRRKKRRDGGKGPGPITIQGRRIILSKLLKLQNEVKTKLITDSELAFIYREWERDSHS